MKLKIEFDTDNAAFDDVPAAEILRILQATSVDIADHISLNDIESLSGDIHPIRDVNGNTVGKWFAEGV